VRQFIHQDEGGVTGQGSVQIEFREDRTAILDRASGEDLERFEKGLGLSPPVGVHPADHHVHALGATGVAASSMA